MKKLIIIYDDSIEVNEKVKTIIGKNHYGEIILKRKKLFNHFKDVLEDSKVNYQIYNIKNISGLNESFQNKLEDGIIFHYFSNNPITNRKEFEILMNKILYANDNFKICDNGLIGIVFKNKTEYLKFLNSYLYNSKAGELLTCDTININACLDISDYYNLLYYISGGFDSRYFNSVNGDEYILVKSSSDKKKIRMEYMYYQLLPDYMKKWMVMPYDYKEEKDRASYTMERIPMTDIAIRWTHGAVNEEELRAILDKTFYFIDERPVKKVSADEYQTIKKNVYIEKLDQRIEKLKKCDQYEKLSALIQSGTEFKNIDEIVSWYKDIYRKVSIKDKYNELVIGHGDLFFANMLYSKEVNMLKLIDPKGALEEQELWMHPLYDIVKLSHSICGNYDFFNVNRYSINLDKNMKFELDIYFDNKKYSALFLEYLKARNLDYNMIRFYEASLFLSMLPLHIDNLHKVLGFLLNAISILKEVEKNV